MSIFLSVLIILETMMGFMALMAYGDNRGGMLWLSQMLRWESQGLPFSKHWGMWGSALAISPLVAYIVALYWSRWALNWVVGAVLIGSIVSYGVNETYKKGVTWTDSLIANRQMTEAGDVFRMFMAVTFAIFVLYYARAPYTRWMWAVSAILIAHAIVSQHVWYRFTVPGWFPWQKFAPSGAWQAVGVTTGLTLVATTCRAFRLW